MMRVLVTGGTGFLGRALIRALLDRGDQVTVLTRDVKSAPKSLRDEARVVAWTPGKPGPWEAELSVVDAVVHLAGAPVAKRWTESYKATLVSSRVSSGRALVEAIGKHERRPAVVVSASGVGYYGADRPGRVLDEDSPPGTDFIAKLCIDWEQAIREAEAHGVRTVQLRIGVVLGPGGGALGEMVQLGGAFVGGPVGKGDNALAWISLDDVVGMVLWALDDDRVSGPINCTSPNVTTQRELAKSAGSVLGRPAIGVPEAVMRMVLGEVVDVLCGSVNAQPTRALELGYEYHHARLVPALEAALVSD